MKGRMMMATELKKAYESPELEVLTLTTPEHLASLSVGDDGGEPETYSLARSGVWTPWV